MERIGVRELRQHASRYLDKVKAGETVEVTERGRLVAFLVPATRAATARDELIASGRLRPGSARFTLPARSAAGTATAEVLADLRDDR